MSANKIIDLADSFWRLAGVGEAYPRPIELAVSWALPLAVVKLPALHIGGINEWMGLHGVNCRIGNNDRSLRACLVAAGGSGLVFLAGTDPADEQRFSIAHEVAHFLHDYLLPRTRAIDHFGTHIEEVLDGVRSATPEERFSGLLNDVGLKTFTHLMERNANGGLTCHDTINAEDGADRFALELLAPFKSISARLSQHGIDRIERTHQITLAALLTDDFGLPKDIAQSYSRHLIARAGTHQGIRSWLGM